MLKFDKVHYGFPGWLNNVKIPFRSIQNDGRPQIFDF